MDRENTFYGFKLSHCYLQMFLMHASTFCRHNIGLYALDMNTKCASGHHIIHNKRKDAYTPLTGWFVFFFLYFFFFV